MKLRTFFPLLLASVVALGGTSASAEMPEGDYIYSNLCIGPWGLIGHRIVMEYRKGANNTYVTGWVPNTFGLDRVTGDVGEPPQFDPKTGVLFFPYQTKYDDYDFNGIATEDHLEGIFGDMPAFDVLPRVAEITEPVKCDPNHMPPHQ